MSQAPTHPAPHTESVESFIEELEAYSRESGLAVSTICNRATNKTRLVERIRRKAELMEIDMKKVRAFMQEYRAIRARAGKRARARP